MSDDPHTPLTDEQLAAARAAYLAKGGRDEWSKPAPEPVWTPCDRADLRDGDEVRVIQQGVWSHRWEGLAPRLMRQADRYERLSPSTEKGSDE